MIERTGFGKSLCFQFPATQFPGITVIFSPLIALMRDQVRSLCAKGIPAAYINSEQTPEENDDVIRRALDGKIKILYIAPERQENRAWMEAVLRMNFSMVVIDEAHTISTWGHDFRPSFRRIINLVQQLPLSLPLLATTATATKRVQHDIEQQIGGKLTTIRGSLNRPNFHLYVIRVQSEDDKMKWLAAYVNRLPGTGIIYTGTRVDTEIYARWLQFMSVKAIDYNAGIGSENRKNIEAGLMANDWKCIVSTNALGMGIDKPDIRFIIHTQMPASPIHYYQEIGRAGRDGQPAYIILFYNESKAYGQDVATDLKLPLSFIENARPNASKYHKVIEALKEEPLSEREIINIANLKKTQISIIRADLIEQGIVKEVMYGSRKKYEYQYNAPELNTASFEQLKQVKLKDLRDMEQYVYTDMPRMQYLCSFLDSNEETVYENCDNTNLHKQTVPDSQEIAQKLEQFLGSFTPVLDLASFTRAKENRRVCIFAPNKLLVKNECDEITEYEGTNFSNANLPSEDIKLLNSLLRKASRMVEGYAAAYYGVSNVGATLHRCKYENGGDFPDFLLKKALSVFGKKFGDMKIDLVLYVPPTKSGNLVKNFATKFASVINAPISHDLTKTRITKEQKSFQSSFSKKDNVAGAFDISQSAVRGKTILLLDDICDSGATLKEIGSLLTARGAKYIIPIVIAKTVGGTL